MSKLFHFWPAAAPSLIPCDRSSSRAERARSRLRQAAIEKRARSEISETAIDRLEALGLLGAIDEGAARAELREAEAALDALEELQTWVEGELASAA